ISVLDGDVLSFYVTKLAQSCLKWLETDRLGGWGRWTLDTLYVGLSLTAAAPRRDGPKREPNQPVKRQSFFYPYPPLFTAVSYRLSSAFFPVFFANST